MKYSFANIVIDAENFTVSRDQQPIDVEPLIFNILLYFVTHPDQVISRDELLENIWAGKIVSDTTISSAIKHARKVIGDSGQIQIYIKTIHGRGFRFIGQLSDEADTAIQHPVETRSPVSQKLSIMILPFRIQTDIALLQGLIEGMTSDLETMLTRVPLLKISSEGLRYSHQKIKPTARQIYEDTGTQYILEGDTLLVGDTLRLTVQLTDAIAGFRIWSERFEITRQVIEARADQLVLDVMSKLEPQLNRSIYESVCSNQDQPTARELYLQANGLLAIKGWHRNTFLEAANLMKKSEQLDPGFALPVAHRTLLLAFGYRIGAIELDEKLKQEAYNGVERALQLDNMDSTVVGYVGCALADMGDITRARPLLKNAIDLNQTNAQAWVALGAMEILENDLEKAISHMSHGIAISPLDARLSVWGSILAATYILAGDLQNALAQAELACLRDDRAHLPRVVLAAVKLLGGNSDHAQRAMREAHRIHPELSEREISSILGQKLSQQLHPMATPS